MCPLLTPILQFDQMKHLGLNQELLFQSFKLNHYLALYHQDIHDHEKFSSIPLISFFHLLHYSTKAFHNFFYHFLLLVVEVIVYLKIYFYCYFI